MKQLTLATLIIAASALFLAGCTGEQGPAGPTGPTGATGAPGPEAKYYDFSLVFSPTIASGYFSLVNTIYTSSDLVVTYWKVDTVTYVQLPYTLYPGPGYVPAYIYSYIDLSYGVPWLYIVSEKADNTTGSPWASTSTFYFRAVVIKASAGKSAPVIDYKNYPNVKEYFNFDD